MRTFFLAILVLVIVLVSRNGFCQPLDNADDTGHNLVKRADPPAPAAPSGGTDKKFKFGMGYGYPYMGYPGFGYPSYGYGMPGMGMGYGGGFGGSYGGGFGGMYGGGMGGGMFGRR